MTPWVIEVLAVGTGLLAGVLIGIERGWKLKDQKAGTQLPPRLKGAGKVRLLIRR